MCNDCSINFDLSSLEIFETHNNVEIYFFIESKWFTSDRFSRRPNAGKRCNNSFAEALKQSSIKYSDKSDEGRWCSIRRYLLIRISTWAIVELKMQKNKKNANDRSVRSIYFALFLSSWDESLVKNGKRRNFVSHSTWKSDQRCFNNQWIEWAKTMNEHFQWSFVFVKEKWWEIRMNFHSE